MYCKNQQMTWNCLTRISHTSFKINTYNTQYQNELFDITLDFVYYLYFAYQKDLHLLPVRKRIEFKILRRNANVILFGITRHGGVELFMAKRGNKINSGQYRKILLSTRMGFEPTRAEPNGLAVHRLNHSATSSSYIV